MSRLHFNQKALMRFTLLVVCATTAAGSWTGHATVPFQYAWRFHYGDDPSSPPESGPGTAEFTQDLQDFHCNGMEHNPNRFSEKDCRIACMYDPNCYVWLANPNCFHGYSPNVTCTKDPKKPSNMAGGRRTKPPSPAFRTDYGFGTADASSTIDADWEVVDAPHDFIAERGNFTNNVENFKQGYLERNASWYRKHFTLPAEWEDDGGATYLHFEGVFHHATFFLNGKYLQQHECGYTGFSVRLDNATGLRYGEDANVLALRADASFGSGHWYEGGGIYRGVTLEHVPATHVVLDGLFVTPETDGSAVRVAVELESFAPGGSESVSVACNLLDTDGRTVLATATSADVAAAPGATVTATATLRPKPGSVRRWTTRSPTLYSVSCEVSDGGDTCGTRVGFRTTQWSGKDGEPPFALNGDAVHFRGFSHHNSIGGLGTAIPERIELFRVQASRAMGANIWRMSHNPYSPSLYSLLDAAGTMCWDENRDYGAKYMGGAYARAMGDMVKRDRNHPSIIVWSFCNEYECIQNDANYSGFAYRAAAYGVDGTRPVTANGPAAAAALDVQGFSHKKNDTFVSFHTQSPGKPSVLSECCSCSSQRQSRGLSPCIGDENSPGLLPYVTGSLGVWTLMDYFGEPHSAWPSVSCDYGQFDIAGFPKPHAYWYAANWAQSPKYFDSVGRPPLPKRTVARLLGLPGAAEGGDAAAGHNDISGITSAPYAELFVDGASQGVLPTPLNARGEFQAISWAVGAAAVAGNCTAADAGSFPINASGVQCHNLHRVSASTTDACARACCADAYCNTWQLDLSKGGRGCWVGHAKEAVGQCSATKQPGPAWAGGQRTVPAPPVPTPVAAFKNATMTACADEACATVLARHTLFAPTARSEGYRLQLTLDVPSKGTGTGGALLLDGRDTALVRAAVVDPAANNALVSNATDRITWRIVSGPGRAHGIANGDPTSHEPLKSDSVNAYLGLARGVFRVTKDCVSPGRDHIAATDVDLAHSPTDVEQSCEARPIVVEASAPGFAPVTLSIPTSTDVEKDGAFAIAATTASDFADGFSYLDNFVG